MYGRFFKIPKVARTIYFLEISGLVVLSGRGHEIRPNRVKPVHDVDLIRDFYLVDLRYSDSYGLFVFRPRPHSRYPFD